MHLSSAILFQLTFLLFLIIYTVLKLSLNYRQLIHLKQHRDYIPVDFQGLTTLTQHIHLTDYQIKKVKSHSVQTLIEVSLLFFMTFGSGFALILDFWAQFFSPIKTFYLFHIVFFSSVFFFSYCLNQLLQFGLNLIFDIKEDTMHFRQRFYQGLKEFGIAMSLGLPFLCGILWIMQQFSAWWWYVWLFLNSFILFVMFIFPVWIDPLFVKTIPLEDDAFQQECMYLFNKCGFTVQSIFMTGTMHALSERGIAYVTGIGRQKRIVLHAKLFARLNYDEIKAVIAHELGHLHYCHAYQRFGFVLVSSFFILYAMHWLITQTWFYTSWSIFSPSPFIGILLLLWIGPIFLFWLQPLANYFSQQAEFKADQYAAQKVNAPALVHVFLTLGGEESSYFLSDPWYSLVYESHPPLTERIAFLRQTQHKKEL